MLQIFFFYAVFMAWFRLQDYKTQSGNIYGYSAFCDMVASSESKKCLKRNSLLFRVIWFFLVEEFLKFSDADDNLRKRRRRGRVFTKRVIQISGVNRRVLFRFVRAVASVAPGGVLEFTSHLFYTNAQFKSDYKSSSPHLTIRTKILAE